MNPLMLLNDKTKKTILIGIAILILFVVAYFVFKAIKKNISRKQFNNIDGNTTQSLANVYVNRLRSAFNPSGAKWLIGSDGTIEKPIFEVADLMLKNKVPFKTVATIYYNAYKDDLAKRLQSELDATELADFYRRIGQ